MPDDDIGFKPDDIDFQPDVNYGPEMPPEVAAKEDVNTFVGPQAPTGIKATIDRAIAGRRNQLSGEESGILNPNPDQNPILNKPLLRLPHNARFTNPELFPEDNRSLVGKVIDSGYEGIVSLLEGLTSPLGIYGIGMGSNPADMSLEATGAIPKLPPSPLRPSKLAGELSRLDLGNETPYMKLVDKNAIAREKLKVPKPAELPSSMERFGAAQQEGLPYPLNVVPNRLRPTQEFFNRNVPASIQERTTKLPELKPVQEFDTVLTQKERVNPSAQKVNEQYQKLKELTPKSAEVVEELDPIVEAQNKLQAVLDKASGKTTNTKSETVTLPNPTADEVDALVKQGYELINKTSKSSTFKRLKSETGAMFLNKGKSKEDYLAIGSQQRGKPEAAMLNAAHKMGGGVMQPLIEHVGDLTHRMNDSNTWGTAGFEFVNDKVNKTLRWLNHPYGFEKEFAENLRSNADYHKVDPTKFQSEVELALQNYADAHKALPAYNTAQQLARDSAVAIGERRFGDARSMLSELKKHLSSPEEWKRFAHEGVNEGLLGDERGAMFLGKRKKPELEGIRNQIITDIVKSGKIPNLNDYYSRVSDKLSKQQFGKLIDDIIESGDLSKVGQKAPPIAQPVQSPVTGVVNDSPVGKLLEIVRQHNTTRMDQDRLVSMERSRRFGEVENAPGEGASKLFSQMRSLKGEYPKLDAPRLQEAMASVDMDLLLDMADNAKLPTMDKFRAKLAVAKVLGIVDNTGPLQPNELASIKQVYGEELAAELVELYSGMGALFKPGVLGHTWRGTKELNNAARTLWASIDFSAPLRQGQGLMFNKEYLPAVKEMFKYGLNEGNYQALIEHLNTRPNAALGRKAGLFISNIITDSPTAKEEMYLSKLAEKIPGVRGSERAYTGFLDKLRADVFDRMIADAQKAGIKTHDTIPYKFRGQDLEKVVPTQFTKEVAKYINAASGRGDLGKLGKYSDVLNLAFYSPKFQASRIQMLAKTPKVAFEHFFVPEKYATMDPMIRRQYLKSMLAMGSMVATSTGMSALLGHEVNLNPLSSDFLKGRFGERTRQDAGAGFLQYVTLAARLMSNQKQLGTGETTSLDRYNKDGTLNRGYREGVTGRAETLGRFARSKESPIASFIHDWVTMRDYLGRPFRYDNAIASRFVPAVIQDLLALKDEDPELVPFLDDNNKPTLELMPSRPELLPLGLGNIFGVGTNVYSDRQN